MEKNKIIQKIRKVIYDTTFCGHVYVAGGMVRDHIMGREAKDIDIVVSLPDGGIRLAKFLEEKLNTTKPVLFPRFGTAQIVIDGVDVELCMTRRETYNFVTRNPEVSFGDIFDDVKRRDFTINAILYDISNNVIIDNVGGVKDIKKRVIRTTSDPKVIFAEDPLRIMRGIRFMSQLGFRIEDETWIQICKHVPELKRISNERIRDEFNKILLSDNFAHGIANLKSTGILEYMIPEFARVDAIKDQGKYHTKDLMSHTMEVMINTKPTIEHRISALLHDIGKPRTMSVADNGDIHFFGHQSLSRRICVNFMKHYKYTNEQIELVSLAISMHMSFTDDVMDKTIRKYVNEIGKDNLLFCLDLAEADSKRESRRLKINKIREFVENDVPNVVIKLPIDGNMVMDRYKLSPSKKVGDILNKEKELLYEFPDIDIDSMWTVLDFHFLDGEL